MHIYFIFPVRTHRESAADRLHFLLSYLFLLSLSMGVLLDSVVPGFFVPPLGSAVSRAKGHFSQTLPQPPLRVEEYFPYTSPPPIFSITPPLLSLPLLLSPLLNHPSSPPPPPPSNDPPLPPLSPSLASPPPSSFTTSSPYFHLPSSHSPFPFSTPPSSSLLPLLPRYTPPPPLISLLPPQTFLFSLPSLLRPPPFHPLSHALHSQLLPPLGPPGSNPLGNDPSVQFFPPQLEMCPQSQPFCPLLECRSPHPGFTPWLEIIFSRINSIVAIDSFNRGLILRLFRSLVVGPRGRKVAFVSLSFFSRQFLNVRLF